jgi:hypothetical protein
MMKRSLPFILLQTSNIASGVGNGIVMITVPWLVLELTGSSSAAGLLGALASLPGIVVSPFIGTPTWIPKAIGVASALYVRRDSGDSERYCIFSQRLFTKLRHTTH